MGSTKPIEGLSAVMSDLKGTGSTIPATAVTIRYGVQWGRDASHFGSEDDYGPSYANSHVKFFLGISKAPPAKYAVGMENQRSSTLAVAPVWITVNIPKNAAPGVYTGMLSIKTSEKTMPVPVALKVLPWTLPNSQDFRTWVDLIESPDTLAVEYGVPLWSGKHFKMIAESFSLISGTGSRTLYIPAIAHSNLGNEESMIRWIKKGNNQFDFDFSIMDQYLDVAQKNMGNPKIVTLNVWDLYMQTKGAKGRLTDSDLPRVGSPQVTFIDPVSKKTELGKLPPLSDPASSAIWKNLLEQVQARLKTRGLDKTLMLGMFTDQQPSKEDIQFFAAIAPKLEWVQQGHTFPQNVQGVNVGYNATVWGGYRFADGLKQTQQNTAATTEALMGWSRPHLDAVFQRNLLLDVYPATYWYFYPEAAITSELRGIGRVGADYWLAVKNKSGKRTSWVHERFAEGSWAGTSISLVIPNALLSPGLDGPEATTRLLALIEGVQMCEARICMEQAMKSGLTGDLKNRCAFALNDRLFTMWHALSNLVAAKNGATAWRWSVGVSGHHYFLGSSWQDQAERIYNLADEVQHQAGK